MALIKRQPKPAKAARPAKPAKVKATKKRASSPDPLAGTMPVNRLTAIPREGWKQDERGKRTATFLRRYYKVCAALMPLMLLVTLIAMWNRSSAPAPVDNYVLAQKTRPVAMSAVRKWMFSDPPPLPGGYIVSWDKMDEIENLDTRAGTRNKPHPKAELHHLTLADNVGNLYECQVTTITDADGNNPMALGDPSLSLMPPSTPSDSDPSWPDGDSLQTSGDIQAVLNTWAKSLANNDAATLKITTGDPDSSHYYYPMVGTKFIDVTPSKGVHWTPPSNPQKLKDFAVVRVALTFNRADWKPSKMGYDVLLSDASTSAPKVVAWGGLGSASTLVPYQNAVVMDQAAQNETTPNAPSAAATGTATPSAKPSAPASTPAPAPASSSKPAVPSASPSK